MAELSLTGLRVLREVAARGSFTAAADALGYTQSAVSRQVAGLEAAAGAPLFAREARGVRLTEPGRILLRHAGEIVDQLEAAQRELDAVGDLTAGRLRVGAFPTAIAALLPRALAAFGIRHAGIEVALREGTTPSQLRRVGAGATELAVVGTLPGQRLDDPHIALEQLLDDPMLLAVPREHALARRRSVELDELAHERWIAGSANAGETFLGLWESPSWEPRVAFVAREWTAKLGLVAAGLGVTLVPGIAVTALREDIALVRVRSESPATRSVVLATRAGAEPPHARAFADVLHEVAAELSAETEQRIQA